MGFWSGMLIGMAAGYYVSPLVEAAVAVLRNTFTEKSR